MIDMAKVYIFLADGFEEAEAMIPVDVLRRGGIDIKTVSVNGSMQVTGSHGVTMTADLVFEQTDLADATLLILPGGLPGATNLNDHEGLKDALLAHNSRGGKIAAICAAPLVLGGLGLLRGRPATCYPGFEGYMTGAEYTHELCTVADNITTGEGPAAAFPFAYALLSQLAGEDKAREVAEGMMYLHLMKSKG